jgi:toluene monooxygenase system protein E
MSENTEVLKPLKTWSHLSANRRRPSEYEIVSVNLHGSRSMLNERPPFELSDDLPMNEWYRRYRNETALNHQDWNAFRDPDEMTYRAYNILQDGQETYIEGLFDEFDERENDLLLPQDWLKVLARCYTPARYPFHALQMASAYVGQVAPASTITNTSYFQAADHLRLLSHTAYRTKELANRFPNLGFGSGERAIWEKDPCWQGFRELLERALATFDWSEAFVAICLVAKPMADECLLRQLGIAARRNDDTLLGMLTDAQLRDSDRARRWASALAKFLGSQAGNQDLMAGYWRKWMPLAEAAARAYCQALAGGEDPGEGERMAEAAIGAVADFALVCGVSH